MNPLMNEHNPLMFQSHEEWTKLIDKIMARAGMPPGTRKVSRRKSRFGFKIDGVFLRFVFTADEKAIRNASPKGWACFAPGHNIVYVRLAKFDHIDQLRDVLCHEMTHFLDRENCKWETYTDPLYMHFKLALCELRAHAVQDCFSFHATPPHLTEHRLHHRDHHFYENEGFFGDPVADDVRRERIAFFNEHITNAWKAMRPGTLVPECLTVQPPETWQCTKTEGAHE